jgi:two-component system NarL family sensor kinase
MSSAPPSRREASGAATTVRRRAWVRPVVQFIVAGLVAVIVLILAAAWFSKRAATEEAITDARGTTVILATSVAEPEIPPGLSDLRVSAQDKFDRIALDRLLVGSVVRIKIWNADGTILYSDKTQLIGENFAFGPEERDVLEDGGSDAEVSDLTGPENRYEQDFGRLLEVYTRIHAPNGDPLLFEAYYSYDDVLQRSSDILASFRPITIAGLLIFVGLTMPLVWVLARRLDRAAADRERLLVAAVEASEQERRRIARDLHDGVVQDLAGLSFAASATARDAEDRPELAQRLEAIGQGVRQSLRALRSLLVEIYPPELRTEGLSAALDDLVAPAIAAGVTVELDVDGTEGASDEAVALVWRAAQETVRNALRHGSPQHLSVVVTDVDGRMRLVVTDDGVGFDPATSPRDGHLGLRGLRDLIVEMGGSLDIDSAPGAGTRVTMEVVR